MASKTSSARRAGSAPPVLEKSRRPDMLKPRKDVSKKKGGSSSSGAAMPARPPPPPTSFVIFILEFVKSKECESVVAKAAEDKWNSMSEAEKGPYERKAFETCIALGQAADSYTMKMNARKATSAAAPPMEEKLSEAATTGGPVEE